MCNDATHSANSFLKAVIPKWKKMKKQHSGAKGSPLLLVVCPSAIRSVEYIRYGFGFVCYRYAFAISYRWYYMYGISHFRSIADFKGEDGKVAKLFAKHLKVVELNSASPMNYACMHVRKTFNSCFS